MFPGFTGWHPSRPTGEVGCGVKTHLQGVVSVKRLVGKLLSHKWVYYLLMVGIAAILMGAGRKWDG